VTGVVPLPNAVLGWWEAKTWKTEPESSVAVGAFQDTLWAAGSPALKYMDSGQLLMTGATVSPTRDSHVFPPNPDWHSHMKYVLKGTQPAPFLHGLLTQGSLMGMSQLWPMKPMGQVQ